MMSRRMPEHLATRGTALAALLVVPTMLSAQQLAPDFRGETYGPTWTVKASQPYLIGGYGDNFVYDGQNVTKLKDGVAFVHVNAETNKGWLLAKFTGEIHPAQGKHYEGEVTVFYPMFMAQGPEYWEGGVADYVILHGNTGREAPVMPTIPTYLASWGPSMVMVDGERIHMGPGHMMLTERSRAPDMSIPSDREAENGPEHYSPRQPSHGKMYAPDQKELHFISRGQGRDEGNFPPFDWFLHLNYQHVEMNAEIPDAVRKQAEMMQQRAKEMMKQQQGR